MKIFIVAILDDNDVDTWLTRINLDYGKA